MKSLSTILSFCLPLALAYENDTAASGPRGPRVKLDYATYVGKTLSNGVDQFLGMRYAAPPVGDLRWRAPAPPGPQGVQTAQEFGNFCIGTGQEEGKGVGEDCLFVNVWAPSNATEESKLPVWVFIQGGGYNQNYSPNYNGSQVVETSGSNIIQVNFNYRVGVYGFLASKEVEEHGDLNNGLRDQIALLRWVQDNIAKFGGDPEHVVIHGSSAGAGSVALHLISPHPETATLFAGGIMESVFIPQQPRTSEVEWQYERLVANLGCTSNSTSSGKAGEEMACLRSRDTNATQTASLPSAFPGSAAAETLAWYWVPVIDGDLIPDEPLRLFAKGAFTKVPMIIGNNQNEGAYFVPQATSPEQVVSFLDTNYPGLTAADNAKITEYYPLMPPAPPNSAYFPSVEQAYGESTLTCPALSILEAIRSVPGPDAQSAWSYHNVIRDGANDALGLGTPHGYEEAAIFGPDNVGRNVPPESFYTYNAPLVGVFMRYWISFVRGLEPNGWRDPEAPEWRVWDGKSEKLRIELGGVGMEGVGEDLFARCAFWEGVDRSLGAVASY